MQATYISLSESQVGLAALLIVINAAISLGLRLGLERALVWASVRTVGQLLLLGLILKWIFELSHWYAVGGIMVVMTVVAGVTAVQRVSRRYSGIWFDTILSIFASSWLITAFALHGVLQSVEPWYHPQYAIPLLGMILGNTLNGISLGLETFISTLSVQRDRVEMMLTLGGTRWEAARESVRQALRTGMMPILNSMTVVGIVSLPGMMTGQLLAGTEPGQAVKYQIVIMFLICSATALGTLGVVLGGYRRLFNGRHQFCHWQIVPSSPAKEK